MPETGWLFTMCFLYSCIVTCGSDGDVRIWEDLDDDDPKSINVGEKAYSCALKVVNSHINWCEWYWHVIVLLEWKSFL